jgi:hypothetical protein
MKLGRIWLVQSLTGAGDLAEQLSVWAGSHSYSPGPRSRECETGPRPAAIRRRRRRFVVSMKGNALGAFDAGTRRKNVVCRKAPAFPLSCLPPGVCKRPGRRFRARGAHSTLAALTGSAVKRRAPVVLPARTAQAARRRTRRSAPAAQPLLATTRPTQPAPTGNNVPQQSGNNHPLRPPTFPALPGPIGRRRSPTSSRKAPAAATPQPTPNGRTTCGSNNWSADAYGSHTTMFAPCNATAFPSCIHSARPQTPPIDLGTSIIQMSVLRSLVDRLVIRHARLAMW